VNHWKFRQGEWEQSEYDERTGYGVDDELREMGFDTTRLMRFGDFEGFGGLAFEVFESTYDERHLFKLHFWGGQEFYYIVTTDLPSFLQLLNMLLSIIDFLSRHNNWEEWMLGFQPIEDELRQD